MRSRLFWRRSAAAAGTYASAVLGFAATVVALHVFSTETFGLYALVLATTAFIQSLLDLTVEEALVKYGFRYTTREDWGRLRRLFESAVAFKLVGGGAGDAAPDRARAVRGHAAAAKHGLDDAAPARCLDPARPGAGERRRRSLISARPVRRARVLPVRSRWRFRFTAVAVAARTRADRDDRGDRSRRRSSRRLRSASRAASRSAVSRSAQACRSAAERREIVSLRCPVDGCDCGRSR